MMKSRICILLIAALVFSVFAMLPMPFTRAEEDDPFQYSYPIVAPPDFAFNGPLNPGQSTPFVTVTITFTGPATLPVTSIGPWQAEVTDSNNVIWNWAVTAIPGPPYNWPTATSTVVVQISVTVPANWNSEECVTFNVKLLGGKDSKTPTPRDIAPGEGVHFKVCVKIPPQQVLKIECKSFMTDTNFNPISSFDLVWTPKDPKGRDYYKLASTNPGQFMYNIWIKNTGTVNIATLVVTYSIDPDFVLKGADPIQVWTGYAKTGTRITNVTIVGNVITINSDTAWTFVPGAEIWITFHLEYAYVRQYWSAAQVLTWKADHEPNNFSATIVASAPGFPDFTCSSSTSLPDPPIVLGVEV